MKNKKFSELGKKSWEARKKKRGALEAMKELSKKGVAARRAKLS